MQLITSFDGQQHFGETKIEKEDEGAAATVGTVALAEATVITAAVAEVAVRAPDPDCGAVPLAIRAVASVDATLNTGNYSVKGMIVITTCPPTRLNKQLQISK